MAEPNTKTQPVTLTDRAIKEVKHLRVRDRVPEDQYLRVGVKGGGCSGMSYVLGFDEATDKDLYFEQDGLTIIMEKAHQLYLQDMSVDYQDGLNARGFVFNNPNATETCGCGTSFSA